MSEREPFHYLLLVHYGLYADSLAKVPFVRATKEICHQKLNGDEFVFMQTLCRIFQSALETIVE